MNHLERANKYQEKKAVREEDRPVYHVTPPTGWMNDPNGFSLYEDKIHLFFQYYPFGDTWGPMHWGHCTTNDFVRWENLPVALAPDKPYDAGGCFSGSAIDIHGKQALIYTGSAKNRHDKAGGVIQQQCLAFGDGIAYEKYAHNPVIGADMLPEGFQPSDFRDPKVFRYHGIYYMVVSAMDEDGYGQILIYSSPDLEHWAYVDIVAGNHGEYGHMWECPDFFELGDRHVVIASPMGMEGDDIFHPGFGTLAMIGTLEPGSWKLKEQSVLPLDGGCDFYAPQTMCTADGRRVMIAWMQAWNNYIKPKEQKWHGMMTFPRELRLEGGTIKRWPVKELEAYRTGPVVLQDVQVSEATQFDGVHGRVLDLAIRVKQADTHDLRICFATGTTSGIVFRWDPEACEIVCQRMSGAQADAAPDLHARQRMKTCTRDGELHLRFLLDIYSAELFVNDGDQTFTSTFYAPMEAQDIVFESEKGTTIDIEKYAICVPERKF